MTLVVESDSCAARVFHQKIMGGMLRQDCKGIILRRDGEVIASVLYEGFNGANVFAHIAAIPGGRWLTREFLRAMFHYPFVQLGVQRITGMTDASNWRSRVFNGHLGFKPEAILKRAGRDGGDAVIYAMFREDCKYVDPPQEDLQPLDGQRQQQHA